MTNISDIKILMVEGKRGSHTPFGEELVQKGYTIQLAKNGKLGADKLADDEFDMVIVDAASLRTKGTRITEDLLKVDPSLPIILITTPDAHLNGNVNAKFVLELPFTAQKLINRIKTISPREPKNIITAGPIHLGTQNNYLRCKNREAHITPRLVLLLKTLIAHQGHIIPREDLFKEVWQTDYLGDTRSLDVHVSWLRKIIEDDPRHPKLLITIRSVGFKLDV